MSGSRARQQGLEQFIPPAARPRGAPPGCKRRAAAANRQTPEIVSERHRWGTCHHLKHLRACKDIPRSGDAPCVPQGCNSPAPRSCRSAITRAHHGVTKEKLILFQLQLSCCFLLFFKCMDVIQFIFACSTTSLSSSKRSGTRYHPSQGCFIQAPSVSLLQK